MALPVVYRRKVGRDLAGGFGWYEEQGKGLGEKFLAAVDSAFDAIERYPEMFSRVHGEVRRALVSKSHTPSSFVSNRSALSSLQSYTPLVIQNSGRNREALRANNAFENGRER